METREETLTSRERVVRTLRREPVDRMPIDLGVHLSTGISAFAYRRLREHLGMPVDSIYVHDMVQFLGRVEADVLERFHCDLMVLHAPWERTTRWRPRPPHDFTIPAAAEPRRVEGGWAVEQPRANGTTGRMFMPKGGFFFDGDWLNNWYECEEDEVLRATAAEARRIYDETDYATMYMGGFSVYFGDLNRLMCMMTEPDAVIEENRARCEADLEKLGRAIDLMGKTVQVVEICGDMGTQSGPMIRPSVVEQCSAPFIKRFCDFVHRHSDWKVFHHCCGAIRPLIPMLIDCGVDALNPVQVSAQGMEPHALKRDFGDELVFWGGGCDTQNVLASAQPDAVRRNVRELVSALKPGGGFVFNQVHNIMGNVPPENVVAMFDEAYAQSFY